MAKKLPHSPVPYIGPTIEWAKIIDESGKEKIVRAREAAQISPTPELKCLCDKADLHLLSKHRVRGGKKTSFYFKTNPHSVHAPKCSVVFRRAAVAALYTPSGIGYDLSKPLRIHLNLPEDKWESVDLGVPSFRIYNNNKDRNGFVDTRYREWESVSVKSLQELLKLMEKIPPYRLRDSLIIINDRAMLWTNFCLSRLQKPWDEFYERRINGKDIVRLFLLSVRKENQDLFAPLNPALLPMRSVELNGKFIINPFIKLSSETREIGQQFGHVAILGTASIGAAYYNRLWMANMTIEATDPRYVTRFDYDALFLRAKKHGLDVNSAYDEAVPP